MSRPIVWLDRSLIARVVTQLLAPFAQDAGWEIRTREDLTAAVVRAEPGIALLDTLEALALVPAASIAVDLAVFSHHASPVVLRTPERPDRIDRAVVSVAGCRPASAALARATVEPFFGLRVVAWQQDGGTETDTTLRVVEDEAALVRLDEHHHDLGRAWFILTGLPFVSHLLVCPPEVSLEARQAFARWAQRLPGELRDRAAEIASDLAAEQPLDAGRVLSYLTEALNVLTPPARRAIEELLRRSHSGIRPPQAEHYRSLSS